MQEIPGEQVLDCLTSLPTYVLLHATGHQNCHAKITSSSYLCCLPYPGTVSLH